MSNFSKATIAIGCSVDAITMHSGGNYKEYSDGSKGASPDQKKKIKQELLIKLDSQDDASDDTSLCSGHKNALKWLNDNGFIKYTDTNRSPTKGEYERVELVHEVIKEWEEAAMLEKKDALIKQKRAEEAKRKQRQKDQQEWKKKVGDFLQCRVCPSTELKMEFLQCLRRLSDRDRYLTIDVDGNLTPSSSSLKQIVHTAIPSRYPDFKLTKQQEKMEQIAEKVQVKVQILKQVLEEHFESKGKTDQALLNKGLSQEWIKKLRLLDEKIELESTGSPWADKERRQILLMKCADDLKKDVVSLGAQKKIDDQYLEVLQLLKSEKLPEAQEYLKEWKSENSNDQKALEIIWSLEKKLEELKQQKVKALLSDGEFEKAEKQLDDMEKSTGKEYSNLRKRLLEKMIDEQIKMVDSDSEKKEEIEKLKNQIKECIADKEKLAEVALKQYEENLSRKENFFGHKSLFTLAWDRRVFLQDPSHEDLFTKSNASDWSLVDQSKVQEYYDNYVVDTAKDKAEAFKKFDKTVLFQQIDRVHTKPDNLSYSDWKAQLLKKDQNDLRLYLSKGPVRKSRVQQQQLKKKLKFQNVGPTWYIKE